MKKPESQSSEGGSQSVKDFLGPQKMRFRCLKCGEQFKNTIADLKAEGHLICPGCGAIYEDAEPGRNPRLIEHMNNSIRHLGEHFRKIQKSLKR